MKKTKTAELTEKLAVVEKANGDLTSQVSGLNLRLANQAQVLRRIVLDAKAQPLTLISLNTHGFSTMTIMGTPRFSSFKKTP